MKQLTWNTFLLPLVAFAAFVTGYMQGHENGMQEQGKECFREAFRSMHDLCDGKHDRKGKEGKGSNG